MVELILFKPGQLILMEYVFPLIQEVGLFFYFRKWHYESQKGMFLWETLKVLALKDVIWSSLKGIFAVWCIYIQMISQIYPKAVMKEINFHVLRSNALSR